MHKELPKLLIVIALLVLFITGALGNADAILLFFFIVAGISVAWLWNKNSFRNLTIHRKLSTQQVQCGTKLQYIIAVTNRKILPVFWLETEEMIPDGINFGSKRHIFYARSLNNQSFIDFFSMAPFQKATRYYEITASKRGVFAFNRNHLSYTDPFSMFKNSRENHLQGLNLTVFPKILPLIDTHITASRLFGDKNSSGWINPDPLNRIGTREYSYGDSMRNINWKSTAKTGNLQSYVLNPSHDPGTFLLLHHTIEGHTDNTEAANCFELLMITTASLIFELINRQKATITMTGNLTSLGKKKGQGEYKDILRNSGNIQSLFTALAGYNAVTKINMEQILTIEAPKIPTNSKVYFMSTAPDISNTLHTQLQKLAQKSDFKVIRIHSDNTYTSFGINPEFNIVERRPWHEVSELSLV
ncbi:DUF58 domain-containing protein [Spirochaeta dissipatitropha]